MSLSRNNVARGAESGENAFGGAIATRPGTVVDSGRTTTVDCSHFMHNLATGANGGNAGEGALYNVESILSVRRSAFVNNQAIEGPSGTSGGNAFGGAIAVTAIHASNLPKTLISHPNVFGPPKRK